MNNLRDSWEWFSGSVYDLAYNKGWWENNRSFLECIGLVISELGEAAEAFRKPGPSSKILAFSEAAEELADVIIRIADLSKHFDIDPWEFHHWLGSNQHLFDGCTAGNEDDNFVCCVDVLLEESHYFDAQGVNNPIEWIALISAYLGEATFGHLHGNMMDVADTLADVIIAVCRLANLQGIDLGEAILAKHEHNASRTYRHGAKLY
jgi:NTP pyrophosphatase (non-canonical NTP hydrolase)